MLSSAWVQKSHLIMSLIGILHTLQILLLLVTYYWLHRKKVARHLLYWSRAKVRSWSGNRHFKKLLSGVLTALILLLPLLTISLAVKFTLHAIYSYYRELEPGWWEWIADEYSSWIWKTFVIVVVGSLYAVLEHLRTLPPPSPEASRESVSNSPPDNWFTRFIGKITAFLSPVLQPVSRTLHYLADTAAVTVIIRFGHRIWGIRESVARSAPYRWWFQLVAISTFTITMQALMGVNLLSTVRLEPVPESPRKMAVLALIERANIGEVPLRLRYSSDNPEEMNAWGVHKSEGARIEFSYIYWNRQSDTAVIQTAGHELFHVLRMNNSKLWAEIFWLLAIFTCLIFWRPKKRYRIRRKQVLLIPVYLMIFVAMWPVYQAMYCAIKRPYEARADMYGVQLAVSNHFITLDQAKESLIKSHEYNLFDPDPWWLCKILFYDHPPLVERLRNMDEAMKQINRE